MLKMAMVTGLAAVMGFTGAALAEDNHVDTQRSDAPELARYGPFNIGVRLYCH